MTSSFNYLVVAFYYLMFIFGIGFIFGAGLFIRHFAKRKAAQVVLRKEVLDATI